MTRCLYKTNEYMLIYKKVDNLEIVGYTNSYLGRYLDKRKSTSGYFLVMVKSVMPCKSKKQTRVVSSITQVKLIASFIFATHVV